MGELTRKHVDAHYRAYEAKAREERRPQAKWSYFIKVEEDPSAYITPTIPKGKSPASEMFRQS